MQPTSSTAESAFRLGKRAVSYGRISDDDGGSGVVKVADQLSQNRDVATERDLDLVEECSDNDISALKDAPTLEGTIRPGFRRVVHLVSTGQVDHIIVWQSSRLVRNRGQRAALIDLCGRMKVQIIAVKGQDFNLVSASGRGLAGMLGEFDTMESEVKSERITEAALRRAKAGRPSAYLGYGWTQIGQGRTATWEVNEAEAEVVREIVRRICAGDGTKMIARDLEARGVPSGRGAGWAHTAVRKIALRPSNASLRLHHRGREDEQVFPGCWPALISVEQWEKVVAVLENPARTAFRSESSPRPGARKHLLSFGIAKCGVCLGPMRAADRNGRRNKQKSKLYVCLHEHVGRDRAKLDAHVCLIVGLRLSKPDAIAWALPSENSARAAAERLAELRLRLSKASDRWSDGRMDDEQYDRIVARLRPQIAEAENEYRMHDSSGIDMDTLAKVVGPQAMKNLLELPLAQKTRLLQSLGVEVFVDRTPKGPTFRPEFVRVTARGQVLHG